MQIIPFTFLGLWPVIFRFKQPYFAAFYVLFVAMLIISAFYVRRFQLFTQKIGGNTLSSKDHLYELYYDLRLVMELYKSWAYILFPFAIIIGLLHLAERGLDLALILTSVESILVVISICVALLFTEIYINVIFGKYIKQLRQLLDELSES